jgi:hypothetical protein
VSDNKKEEGGVEDGHMAKDERGREGGGIREGVMRGKK